MVKVFSIKQNKIKKENRNMIKKYLLYLARWQASTLILAPVIWLMADYSSWAAAIVANLIGGLVFFWIDKWIFKPKRDYTKLLARVDEEMEATKWV